LGGEYEFQRRIIIKAKKSLTKDSTYEADASSFFPLLKTVPDDLLWKKKVAYMKKKKLIALSSIQMQPLLF